MKKKLFSTILVCVLLLLIAVGCNNSPKSKPTPTPQPEEDVTRPATLRVGYFRESYVKGAAKPEGTLYYTDTAGRASSVSIQSADVTTDFDGNTVGENKTLKITYKGIDTIAQYTVVEPEKIDINGVYIVGDNSILIFTTDADGKLTIDKEVWKNWKVYSNFDLGDPTNVTTTEGLEYKIDVTSSGATVIRDRKSSPVSSLILVAFVVSAMPNSASTKAARCSGVLFCSHSCRVSRVTFAV